MLSLEDLWASIVKDIHMDIYNDDKGMYCIYRGVAFLGTKKLLSYIIVIQVATTLLCYLLGSCNLF